MTKGETCRNCGRAVEVMCQKGTGYCGAACQEIHEEDLRERGDL